MTNTYRYVRLLKNHIYPTYQLHAFMANDKTDPKDGLRLAALTTLHWLRSRLGDAAPEDWSTIPSPENYLTTTDEDLRSIYVNQGFVINIVSLPDKGVWTLQITEPDLGADPGKSKQKRPPVPGRIIETNVAYQIVGKQLECGFKTLISDPAGIAPEAEVYRTTVVKLLMENPAFGLRQVTKIPMKEERLKNKSQIKTMLGITHHEDNQLPIVVFTQPVEEHSIIPESELSKARLDSIIPASKLGIKLPPPVQPLKPAAPVRTERIAVDPPYNMDKFTYYTFSHCRTYILEQGANKIFMEQTWIRFQPGDIIVIYPTAFGGGERVIPYWKPDEDWDDNIDAVEKGIKDYLKKQVVDFGGITFLSGAREQLPHLSDELAENAEAVGESFRAKIDQLNTYWNDEIAEKDGEIERLASQLKRQREYASQLEADKAKIRDEFSEERDKLQKIIDTQLETIAFLKRRNDQPNSYDGIEAWVKEHFSSRLILNSRAISRMMTKSNQCADVELVCDALDFLATDYWEMRYLQVPKDEALTRCGKKYGRPFEVKPTGQVTIEAFPGEYRIKYYTDPQGKERDSDLDYHLRVGNDSENLLRIYFLHDDEKQLIVVGSLPDHLRSVKIQ